MLSVSMSVVPKFTRDQIKPYSLCYIFVNNKSNCKKTYKESRICVFSKESIRSEGNGTPLQYSFLENPMDGGAW